MMPGMKAVDIVPTPPATTLTHDQSAQLMNDATFRGRVKVSCLGYAQYISLEATNTPAHNSRFKWAQTVFANPDLVAGQITPPTVLNPNVQQAGSVITDADLDAAVQAVVDAVM